MLQRAAKRDGIRQVVLRHQSLDVLDHEVHQRAFGGGELIAHARQDHVLNLRFRHHFFQSMGKVRNDNDRRRAAVVELMLQFTRGIQGVDVDHDHPGAQDAKQGHRILQQVRHHQGHAIALLQP